MNIKPWRRRKEGMSLVELLCVIAIISILAALFLGPVSRAYMHAKKVLGQ